MKKLKLLRMLFTLTYVYNWNLSCGTHKLGYFCRSHAVKDLGLELERDYTMTVQQVEADSKAANFVLWHDEFEWMYRPKKQTEGYGIFVCSDIDRFLNEKFKNVPIGQYVFVKVTLKKRK